MIKLHIEIVKTKPENPGLEGRLNPGFGFEKSPGYPVFRVRENPGCNPYEQYMNMLITVSKIEK